MSQCGGNWAHKDNTQLLKWQNGQLRIGRLLPLVKRVLGICTPCWWRCHSMYWLYINYPLWIDRLIVSNSYQYWVATSGPIPKGLE